MKPWTDAVDIQYGLEPLRSCQLGRPGGLVSINPFNDDNGGFFVLVNDEEQHSLWPAFAGVPAGRHAVHREADRAACLDCIEQIWAGARPTGLHESLAAGRAAAR